MPFIRMFNSLSAAFSTSGTESAKSIPPAFPLPATSTCAFMAKGSFSLVAISWAWLTLVASSPIGVGIPYFASIVFASYSKSFILAFSYFIGSIAT